MNVCVCVCVCVCVSVQYVCVCVLVCARERECASERARMYVCSYCLPFPEAKYVDALRERDREKERV